MLIGWIPEGVLGTSAGPQWRLQSLEGKGGKGAHKEGAARAERMFKDLPGTPGKAEDETREVQVAAEGRPESREDSRILSGWR